MNISTLNIYFTLFKINDNVKIRDYFTLSNRSCNTRTCCTAIISILTIHTCKHCYISIAQLDFWACIQRHILVHHISVPIFFRNVVSQDFRWHPAKYCQQINEFMMPVFTYVHRVAVLDNQCIGCVRFAFGAYKSHTLTEYEMSSNILKT